MNRAMLTGNLTEDPKIMTFDSGSVKCIMTIAVNRRRTDANGNRVTDFIPVFCWGKTAENCGKYLTKGRKIGVTGSIEIRSYTAQDGSKRTVTEINADEIEFLSSKQDAGGTTGTSSAPIGAPPPQGDGLTEAEDDELPF